MTTNTRQNIRARRSCLEYIIASVAIAIFCAGMFRLIVWALWELPK